MRLETIKIGRIVNAHGIRGEVRVQPDGQDPAFLTQFQTFYLDGAPVTPTANHVHKSLVLMKFPGVDDMNAALALKGKNLYIRRADAKLPEGACFDAELLGMTVCDAATGETLWQYTPTFTAVQGGEAVFGPIRDGMKRMAQTTRVLREAPVVCAAKTGSPQLADTLPGGSHYVNSVLIGYAPADDPQIAVAVVLEYGGGGANAAPILRAVLDAVFGI